MKRGGQRCGEMRVTGLMQTERVCSGRALCRGARDAADRCGGRTPYPGKQSRERVTEQCRQQSGKGAEVRAGKQPNLSFQCDIAAKGPHRSSGWMKGGAAD